MIRKTYEIDSSEENSKIVLEVGWKIGSTVFLTIGDYDEDNKDRIGVGVDLSELLMVLKEIEENG
jgi:hypothetical protein